MATEQPRSIPNWDVDYALDEVVRAIQNGSLLCITKLVEEGYKRRYYADFQNHWKCDTNPNSWPDARERILKLAENVGRLATMLSILQAIGSGKPIPDKVDSSSAYMAGYLVAKVLCPPSSPGVWCMNYYYMEDNDMAPASTDLDLIQDKFGQLLKEVKEFLPPNDPYGGPQ